MPIVTEAIRRLRTTSHQATVIDALHCLYGAYNYTIKTDIIPLVEPLALRGPREVRVAALLALSMAGGEHDEFDRCFQPFYLAVTSGDRKLALGALSAMGPFSDPQKARAMAEALLPFAVDTDGDVRDLAAGFVASNLRDDTERGPIWRKLSPLELRAQAAFREGFRIELSRNRREIILRTADPRDAGWEPVAKEALLCGDPGIALAAVELLQGIWTAEAHDATVGDRRARTLVLEYLSSDDAAKRRFAARHIYRVWGRNPFMLSSLESDGLVIRLTPAARAALTEAGAGPGLVKQLEKLARPE